MDDELKIKMGAFTPDCKDPHKLAKFYAALLKWEIFARIARIQKLNESFIVKKPDGHI